MSKELPVDLRIVKQLAKATVKNLVDGLVELITNSDDSYKRLEADGKKVTGEIKIHVVRKKGGNCIRLQVKDYAEGMTKEELEKAIVYAGETSGFEKGKSVRGLFGRGLKETIIALGKGEIKTIKNHKMCTTRLWLDEHTKKPLYDDEVLNNVKETPEENGTEVNIEVTNEKIKVPLCDNFVEQLTNHFALRDINSSSNRKIWLIFEDITKNTKHEQQIRFSYPKGNKVIEKDVLLPSPYKDKIRIVIYESPETLFYQRNNPFGLAGILIKTKGAILDNQLFRFENEPAALYFFGEALCEGIEEKLRKGETNIIDFNRAGLEWRHEYCQSLATTIEKILEPLVQEKKRTLEKKPEKEIKESTKRLLRKLCNELNRLAKEELEETDTTVEPEPDINNLMIKPEQANIHVDKPRTFSIYAPSNLIETEGKTVHIKSDNSDIQPLASTIELEKHPKYPDKIWYRYFKVVGKRKGAEGNIIAELGTATARAKVKVAPLKERKKGILTGRKGGFVSSIECDESANPSQRVYYERGTGIIRIYLKFPSVAKFIKSGLEGVETPEGRMLLAELVGDAFCKELARQGIEINKYPITPGGEIDGFNATLNELQKKYLHKIQEIIFAWKF